MQIHLFRKISLLFFAASMALIPKSWSQQKNNLSLTGTATASSSQPGFDPSKAIDGKFGEESSWKNEAGRGETWLMLKLPGATEITKLSIHMREGSSPISDFKIQTILNGSWRNVKEVSSNGNNQVSVNFEKPILTDRIRLWIETGAEVVVSELEAFGQQYVDSTAAEVKKILINQSGYNLGRPKRFTAPNLADKSPFEILQASNRKVVFSGIIEHGKGEFSQFNPNSQEEYIIVSGQEESFPFRIGPYWLERVTYRNMVDFMIGARHYVGT
ncbi:MAG TPA: discoidin domain-containing protein, partial [Algoriphagus sp.]|nr:discoidin domain-containing protein [Algoriphagus sp.]